MQSLIKLSHRRWVHAMALVFRPSKWLIDIISLTLKNKCEKVRWKSSSHTEYFKGQTSKITLVHLKCTILQKQKKNNPKIFIMCCDIFIWNMAKSSSKNYSKKTFVRSSNSIAFVSSNRSLILGINDNFPVILYFKTKLRIIKDKSLTWLYELRYWHLEAPKNPLQIKYSILLSIIFLWS